MCSVFTHWCGYDFRSKRSQLQASGLESGWGSGLQFLNLSLNLYKFCCFTSDLITMGTVLHRWGYWCQRAVKRLGDPPPKGDPGSFSGQIQGWNTPREPPGTLLLCVCTIGRSTGVSRTMESDHLSILSIYLKIFLCVFIVQRLVLEILLSYVLVVLVQLSILPK